MWVYDVLNPCCCSIHRAKNLSYTSYSPSVAVTKFFSNSPLIADCTLPLAWYVCKAYGTITSLVIVMCIVNIPGMFANAWKYYQILSQTKPTNTDYEK